jgi:hypothetical protein
MRFGLWSKYSVAITPVDPSIGDDLTELSNATVVLTVHAVRSLSLGKYAPPGPDPGPWLGATCNRRHRPSTSVLAPS